MYFGTALECGLIASFWAPLYGEPLGVRAWWWLEGTGEEPLRIKPDLPGLKGGDSVDKVDLAEAVVAAMVGHKSKDNEYLLGVSRKRFISACCKSFADLPADDRLPGTIAANLIGARAGVFAIRVHDVAEHRQALAVFRSVY